MKKIFCTILIFFALACSCRAFATDLRGRLVRYNPYSRTYFPLGNARVDIWVFNGAQWVDVASSVTGSDGMYYFLRLAPGTNFRIQVFGIFYPPQAWIVMNVPVQDIPQITT